MIYIVIIIAVGLAMIWAVRATNEARNNPDVQSAIREREEEKNKRDEIIANYRKQKIKYCPYCLSTDFQYAGQKTIGQRDAKTKTQHSLNLNPLKPFTLVNSKEKVVRKAKPGYSYDEFICMKCGKRFR